MRTTPTSRRLAATAAALALLVTACGSDGDSDEAVPTPTMEQPATTMAPADTTTDEDPSTTEAPAAESDIVDTAVAAGDFTTLVAAVQAAGLEETLRGDGPFTVFAPSDDAFAALPEGTVEGLLEEPEGALKDILTYHVIAGKVLAADVVGMDGQEVETVNGAKLTIEVGDDGSVSLKDATGASVGVVATDIETSNGVIHVLDGVLMPG